jgi:hypothetical protein
MAIFNGAFPILPGKVEQARAFAAAVSGSRRDAYSAMQKRGGITRETWSLQETPAGAFMLVWFDAADIEHAFRDVGTGTDEFTTWFRDQVKDLTGVDLSEPPEGGPELLVNWQA